MVIKCKSISSLTRIFVYHMKVFKAISVFSLVLLVLVSSSNFMIGIHFCSGDIQNIGFLTKADVCEKEQKQPPCHQHLTAPCCDDETIVHESDELKASPSYTQIASAPVMEIAELEVLISEIIPSEPFSRSPYHLYDPPLPTQEITIANQVFLI